MLLALAFDVQGVFRPAEINIFLVADLWLKVVWFEKLYALEQYGLYSAPQFAVYLRIQYKNDALRIVSEKVNVCLFLL